MFFKLRDLQALHPTTQQRQVLVMQAVVLLTQETHPWSKQVLIFDYLWFEALISSLSAQRRGFWCLDLNLQHYVPDSIRPLRQCYYLCV